MRAGRVLCEIAVSVISTLKQTCYMITSLQKITYLMGDKFHSSGPWWKLGMIADNSKKTGQNDLRRK